MRALLMLAALSWSAALHAADVEADAPHSRSVTIYRAPARGEGAFQLNNLQGFALVTETRHVRLPAGESRLRFAGVADGIEAASALVSGFGAGVIEKNRDAKLLSPSAIVDLSLGSPVDMLRTNKKTGKTERIQGSIVADNLGVVFKSAGGVEALRCSGMPETFSFESTYGAAATPTLSVMVRTPKPLEQTITLSYLTRGFDWSADYTATLAKDHKSMDLGAWVTLANANGESFPDANAQVVAGRLNRQSGRVDPLELGSPIFAQCWPMQRTHETPGRMFLARDSFRSMNGAPPPAPAAMALGALQEISVTGARAKSDYRPQRAELEQLGDLKLYRVPEHTTVASRQLKQVRLLDQYEIPVREIYTAAVMGVNDQGNDESPARAEHLLRTKNDLANHLGLPLPSGAVHLMQESGDSALLLHEAKMRDLAVDEEVEISMGESNGVMVTSFTKSRQRDQERVLPLIKGVVELREVTFSPVRRVEVSNDSNIPIAFELKVELAEGEELLAADRPVGKKNGQPLFEFTVPANGRATVLFQTQLTLASVERS